MSNREKPKRISFKASSGRISLLLQKKDLLCLWALFSSAFTLRIFHISKLKKPILDEYYYCQQLVNLSLHNISRPIIGDLILLTPIKIFYSDSLKSPVSNATNTFEIFPAYMWIKYFNVFISALIPPLITASLRLNGCPIFISMLSGFFIVFEFCNILRSRLVCADSLFNFVVALSLFLNSLINYNISDSLVFITTFICAFSSVIDYSGIVLLILFISNLIISKKKEYKMVFTFISFVVILNIIDLCLETFFIKNESFGHLLIQKINVLFCFKCKRHRLYVFPLWKFIPRLVWERPNQKIYLMNHPIVTLFSSLFCGIGILNKKSINYFISIFIIWFLKRPTNCIDYQIPFFFSVYSIAQYLQNWPMRNLFAFLILVLLTVVFSIWAPWIYGFKISPYIESSINFWKS